MSCEFCQASIVRSSLIDHQLVCEKRKFYLRKTIEFSQVNMEKLYIEQQILDHEIKSQLEYFKEEPKECYGMPKKNIYTAREERPIKPLSKQMSQELFGGRVPQTERTLQNSLSQQTIGQPLMSFANNNFEKSKNERKKQKTKKQTTTKKTKKNTKKTKKKVKAKKEKEVELVKYNSTGGQKDQNQKLLEQEKELERYNSNGTQETKKVAYNKLVEEQNIKSFSKQDTTSTKKEKCFKRQRTSSDISDREKSHSINKKLRDNQSVQIPQHFHKKIASKMSKIEESLRDIEVFKNTQQEKRENVYNQILSKMTVTPKNKLDLMRFQSKQRRLSHYQSSPQLLYQN